MSSPITRALDAALNGSHVIYIVERMTHVGSLVRSTHVLHNDATRGAHMSGSDLLVVSKLGSIRFVSRRTRLRERLAGLRCPVFVDILAYQQLTRDDHIMVANCSYGAR